MVDVHTPETRSYNMSQIKGKNTKPEKMLRSLLHRAGYRFRLNAAKLPGKPDIILPRYRTVIFVHGCFWHRHPKCQYATLPATRTGFWSAKFTRTVERDRGNRLVLECSGWQVLVVWECVLKNNHEYVLETIEKRLGGVTGNARA